MVVLPYLANHRNDACNSRLEEAWARGFEDSSPNVLLGVVKPYALRLMERLNTLKSSLF